MTPFPGKPNIHDDPNFDSRINEVFVPDVLSFDPKDPEAHKNPNAWQTGFEWFNYANSRSGWMYPGELEWLFRQALCAKTVVEIGVWKGRSTAALAAGTPGVVVAIDHFKGSPGEEYTYHAEAADDIGSERVYQEALSNLRPFIDCNRCVLLRLPAKDASTLVRHFVAPRPGVDLLVIDGGHDFDSVKENLDDYVPLVNKGGRVCGHDHCWEGVARAVSNRFGCLVQEGPGSLWYVDL